jgi:hypothetical protein
MNAMPDDSSAVQHANHDRPLPNHDDHAPDDSGHPDSRVIRRSTRVLLDSGSPPTCAACGNAIDRGNKYKSVTLERRDGGVTDLSFCGEHCRSSLLSATNR